MIIVNLEKIMRDIDLVIVDRNSNDNKKVREILYKNGYSFKDNSGLKIHSFTNFIVNHYTKIVNVTYTSRDNYEHWCGFCYNIVTPSYLESFFGGAIDYDRLKNKQRQEQPINKHLCDYFLSNVNNLSEADLRYIHQEIGKEISRILAVSRENELQQKLRTSTPALFWVDEANFVAQLNAKSETNDDCRE